MYRWMRGVSIILPPIIILGCILALVIWSRQPDRFPLRFIEIQSELKHVSEQDIRKAISLHLAEGFFWLNVDLVQKDLKSLAWVENVEIKRSWPDKIIVFIQEKVPQAIWGENAILTTEGSIFTIETLDLFEKLPRFKGPIERAKEIQQQYLSLLELLGPVGLSIQALELSTTGVLRVMLDNGIAIILGKTAISERMARFVLAYQTSLQKHSQRIAYVDLRYTNGMAIGWRQGVQS